ncbi:MAG: hypothetical protein GY809_27360 [Planctomycetes bacterium]|nr:hypothetical protein [Planctomycetota bacterium]
MLCWINRWFIACRVDAKETPGPRLKSHLEACAACRAYYQAQVQVNDLLETQVPPVTLESGESLKGAILGSLTLTETRPGSTRRLGHRTVLAMAASVLITCSVTFVCMQQVTQRKARMREQSTALASVVALPGHLVPSQLLANYGPLMQAPLQSEIENLSMDAQNAALFVVQCTPFARADSSAME